MTEPNCVAGLDAIAQVRDLTVDLRAVERRVDRSDNEQRKLDDRIVRVEERMEDHESTSQQAVRKLGETVDLLRQTLEHAIATTPVSPPTSIVASWSQAPLAAKAKVGGSVIGALTAALLSSEGIKAIGHALAQLISHLVK